MNNKNQFAFKKLIVPGIVMLLGKDFAKLVLLANIIAWPVAYYAMNSWLQDFAYRININLLT